MNDKIGIVAMPYISVGGGFARVTRDLIASLTALGKEVSLLTPFKVDLEKISKLYGPIKLKKIYYPNQMKSFFCKEKVLGRKLIKKEFIKMANEVDFIIDMDGLVLHRYLPKKFDKSNYIIWRVSCVNPNTYKIQNIKNVKILIKKFIKKIVFNVKDLPKNVKIYPLDEWTKKEIISFWGINPSKEYLYPEIKAEEFNSKKKKMKKMIIFGRISQNKNIDTSIKIFHNATKKDQEYELIILGGVTPDSKKYISKLRVLIKNLEISDRVKIKTDPSFDEIKQILSESEILIDSQKGVSLTMTAIEALASGCIILAYKKAGTYIEVLKNGVYGQGFDTIEEGSNELSEIIRRQDYKNLYKSKSIQRAKFFSSKKFRDRLGEIINGKR